METHTRSVGGRCTSNGALAFDKKKWNVRWGHTHTLSTVEKDRQEKDVRPRIYLYIEVAAARNIYIIWM